MNKSDIVNCTVHGLHGLRLLVNIIRLEEMNNLNCLYFCKNRMTSEMNGPQRTAVSRKELGQNGNEKGISNHLIN